MTHYLGIGDDGQAHWWASNGSEELVRVCDKTTATNVEMWARDKHASVRTCERCKEGKR